MLPTPGTGGLAIACAFIWPWVTLLWFLGLSAAAGAGTPVDVSLLPPAASRPVDFLVDIRPLFETRCYSCHGGEKQKSGLRLDRKEDALRGGDNDPRDIRPGRSAESPLIHLVAGLLPDTVMPPKGERLSPEQIGLLRAWIDQGAVWPESADHPAAGRLDWWSLRPLVRPPVPGARSGQCPTNPVDAFILSKLHEKGLRASPEADRRTLIRRLYFDLIGLPPSPEEADTFVADHDPEAYERLVDRLLASPRYGERWARHWLDVAHYGDTHGYDKDQPRPNAWPYRDYVIRAFNTDKPYGRFVREQLAGDALFPDTEDGIVALGFIAAGPWDQIGHTEVPESKTDGQIARLLDRDDMVANTLNTFCSVTVQCARCHNHKFDPIRQEEYYQLQAVFAALDRADKAYDLDPVVRRQRADLEGRKRVLASKRRDLESQIAKAGGKELEDLEKTIAAAKEASKSGQRAEYGWHSAIESSPDVSKWVQVDLGAAVAMESIQYVACSDDFNGIGAGFGFPARFKIEISEDPDFHAGVAVVEDQTAADAPNPGITPRSLSVKGRRARFVRMTATKLAPRQNDYIFALAELSVFDAAGTNAALAAPVTSLDSIEAPPRWSRRNLVDGYYPGLVAKAPPADVAKLEEDRESLIASRVEVATRESLSAIKSELDQVNRDLAQLPPARLVYAGTVHYGSGPFAGTGASGGKPRTIQVLARGEVTKPGKEVGPGTLSFIPELPAHFDLPPDHPESMRRAALAEWITDARNPLTWRSIVNRVWAYHFGRGLVDSPNDFGRMGQIPSHPELLDWLAVEFRDGGQSFKQLHRLLVTSATYRQASEPATASSERPHSSDLTSAPTDGARLDADNRLLWRMNRRKLEAEAVHDELLAVAGKLDLAMGGPGFQDFVIDKPEHSPHYEYQKADPENPKNHRRSIYRFIVRSQPQPFMSALDCADPSMSVDKRNQTLNALQALALRNDKLTIAMARHFAARVGALAAEPEQQVCAAFRIALARSPSLVEARDLAAYAKEYGLPSVCRAILNLNEFLFVD